MNVHPCHGPDGLPSLSAVDAAEKILLSESTVRIFGLTGAPGKTVKIKLSKRPWEYLWGRDPSTLLPGIRAARIASALGSPIQIPGAKAYDRRGRWLVEDVIDGRRLTRPEIAEFLADALLPFYRRTMRPRPLRRVKAARKLIDDLEGMGVESPISALDNLLPFVLGHGDISSNNVLRTPDGGYALIDWDGAAVIPAAFDLAELCAHLDVSVAQGGQSTGQDDDD